MSRSLGLEFEEIRNSARGGRAPDPSESAVSMPIELTPLPALTHFTTIAQRDLVRGLLAQIVGEYPGPFLGVDAVLAQDVHGAPQRTPSTRPPLAHTTCPELRDRYRALLLTFRDAYRDAAREHGAAPTRAVWPSDAFLPASLFVRDDATPSLSSMLSRVR